MTTLSGTFRHLQGVAAGDDHVVVDGQVGQVALAGAGGDDDVVRGEALAGPGYRDGVGRFEDARALYDGHVVLLEQVAYAVGEPLHDRAAAVHGVAEVVLEVIEADAVLFGVAEGVEHLGVLQQRLAGDAAPVQANAAQLSVFHHSRAHTELARANGGDVTARPRTQNQHVVIGQRALQTERRPRPGKRRRESPLQYTKRPHKANCGEEPEPVSIC